MSKWEQFLQNNGRTEQQCSKGVKEAIDDYRDTEQSIANAEEELEKPDISQARREELTSDIEQLRVELDQEDNVIVQKLQVGMKLAAARKNGSNAGAGATPPAGAGATNEPPGGDGSAAPPPNGNNAGADATPPAGADATNEPPSGDGQDPEKKKTSVGDVIMGTISFLGIALLGVQIFKNRQ